MRDLVLRYGFGSVPEAQGAAVLIAQHLSSAMDRRSAACLLVIAAKRDGDRRNVTVWTFPREQAFQFVYGTSGPSIEILTDIFSQTSKLRKAALFEGRHLRTDFLSGRILDYQANRSSQDVANFWMSRFLQCCLSIRGDTGTRLLAKTIKKTVESSSELDSQEQLLAAAMAVRSSPRSRWSLQDFADGYLTGRVRDTFLAAAENDGARVSMFDFEREIFDQALKFGIYRLDTGVWVSSPFAEIGQSVQVTVDGEAGRRLVCEGTIVQEKVSSRHG